MSVAIDNLSKKVKQARNSKSKDIRISIEEAQDVLFEIAKSNYNLQEIKEKVDYIYQNIDSISEDNMDGGRF